MDTSVSNGEGPLVSVIVTNYNYARFLDQCLQSVRQQTYSDLEIVIVDDGSVDSSREIASRHMKEDPRVRLIAKTNGGQATALNVGFAASTGEIVCFLDSDDYWLPEKVARVVERFGQANYSVVQHNHYVVDTDSNLTGAIHPRVSFTGDVLERYFLDNHVGFFSTASGIACRRKDLEQIFPLDESWRICADVPLRIPLPLFGDMFTFEQPLGFYRMHDANNWMLSEGQGDWLSNQLEYVSYANRILARFGVKREMNFRRSEMYRRCRKNHLPPYHPLHVIGCIRSAVGAVLPAQVKNWLKQCFGLALC